MADIYDNEENENVYYAVTVGDTIGDVFNTLEEAEESLEYSKTIYSTGDFNIRKMILLK